MILIYTFNKKENKNTMEMKTLQNGLKTKSVANRKRRKRRNGVIAKPATPVKRRNGVTVARAKSVLKKNGLKAVSTKAVSNRKRHKRRRRNGLTATPRSTRNGILGNTKADAMQVAALGGGALFTELAGNTVNQFVAPYLASFGVGNYSDLISKGFVALVATPYVVGMLFKKGDSVKMARLGGLLVVGLELVNKFFPQVNINPFNNAPIVINSNGAALLTPKGTLDLAVASGADSETVSKMAGAISAVATSNYDTYQNPVNMPYSSGFMS